MPPPKGSTKMTVWHWLVLAVIGPVSVWLLFTRPPTQWALGGFVVLLLIGTFCKRPVGDLVGRAGGER